jgi:hypothetical protein
LGGAVAAIAEKFGQSLMPWQRQVADVGLELLPDGRPAYRAVRFTVPRQSGKTTLILSWEVQRALGWAQLLGPQRIAYSAQTGKDAREKLLEDQVPLLWPRRKLFGVDRTIRTNGSEAVVWRNGSRLILLASGTDSGHGKTIDLGVKDELFNDVDNRRDQALNPAMATRPHAQVLTASTMGTAESLALNMEVESGRAAVEAGKTSGVCYFEWSASPDDDPGDPATWWRCMPALGRTITLEVVEHAYETLQIDEFKRAYLNIPTMTVEQVIPHAAWQAVCDESVEATGALFSFDVNPERSAGGIVAIGPGPIVEVVDYHPGTAWCGARIEELYGRYNAPFVVDPSGPAGSLLPDIRARGVEIIEIAPGDVPRAAGAFYDRVVDGDIRIRKNRDLDLAVQAAAQRSAGEQWAWGRKSSKGCIALLVAATNGVWVATTSAESTPFAVWG